MNAEEGLPHYFDLGGESGFAMLHEPEAPSSTGVLFIPPFGWEESCSYRVRRTWATSLAREGNAVMRFDLPGTGDSSGTPVDAGRVAAWLRAIDAAAIELRALTGCTRVAAMGVGFGGLLACIASSAGADLDELILWAVPGRGRAILRELKAFAQLEVSRQASALPLTDGDVTVNGFVLSAESAAAVGGLDVRASPPTGVRRALLLDRDRIPIDDTLRATLVAGGADVTLAPGKGYATMMAEPQLSVPPWDTMAVVSAWLAAESAADRPQCPPRGLRTDTTVVASGTEVSERLITFGLSGATAVGVLTEPLDEEAPPLCAVLLNAGAIRRIGPNRMWVEAARRWASLGVPTLRLDLASIGDGGGPDSFPFPNQQLYEPRYGQHVRAVIHALVAAGLPPRFLLVGLCSGAYWSFQVAQVDDRVCGVVMLNPMALVYDPFQWTVRRSRFLWNVRNPGTLGRVLSGDVPMSDTLLVAKAVARRAITAPSRLPARVAARRRARKAGGDQLDHELDRLREKGVQALLAFSPGEPLHDELAREGRWDRLGRWPNLTLQRFDGPPAAHMLQPLVLQQQAHALLDSALESLLGASD